MALQAYREARKQDAKFNPEFLHLRIAEVAYKLGLLEVSLEALDVCERIMVKDRHAIHLIKGKCFEKKRHFGWCVEEYECGLIVCREQKLD